MNDIYEFIIHNICKNMYYLITFKNKNIFCYFFILMFKLYTLTCIQGMIEKLMVTPHDMMRNCFLN